MQREGVCVFVLHIHMLHIHTHTHTHTQRPDLVDVVARHPQLGGFLAQPDFMTILQELQTDPQALMKHLNDDRVQVKPKP